MIFPRDDFEKSSCKEANIDKNSLIEMFDYIDEQKLNIHQMILIYDGSKVFEAYQDGYGPGTMENIYSMSKSFTSIAIGICQDKGLLKVTDFVLPYFADRITDPLQGYESLTIEHLLTMRHGQERDLFKELKPQDDVFQVFFHVPLSRKPGTFFDYSNFSVFMLSAIVTRVTGLSLNDFLDQNLYSYLGIRKPSWDEVSGFSFGATALRLDALSLAKVGLLLLNNGKWRDKQLVSEEYVKRATAKQCDTSHLDYYPDSHGYGYLFWMNDFGGYRIAGMYKQCVVINKLHKFVFVAQSYETRTLTDLVKNYLIPGFEKGWSYESRSLRDYVRRFRFNSALLAEAENKDRNS